jgi:hypothetical protein
MRTIAAVIFVVSLAATALALDVNGRWWGNATLDGLTHPIYLTLIREGNTLRGTGGPTKVDQNIIGNGRVEGGRYIFDVLPGGRSALHFELVADGEKLKGTVTVQRNGQPVRAPVLLTKRTND